MDFTIQEINILIDALKAWRDAPSTTAITAGLMGAVMMAGTKEAEAFRLKAEGDIENSRMEVHCREEDAIMIQAKLLQMRRELEAAAADEFGSAVNERARAVLLDREVPE